MCQAKPTLPNLIQAESGGHNSDSAEEVAWIPERHANPSHLPPSPMANAVGPECAAAVNLLCMSVDENPFKQAAQLQQRSSPGTGPKEMSKVSLISASAGCMVQIPPRFEVPIELEYIYMCMK